MQYAVISDRQRQYRVTPGARLLVDHLAAPPGSELELPVLLIADGGSVRIGSPFVAGATARIKVLGEHKGDKIIIGKFKRRKHMTNRRKGFRARSTLVEVLAIHG
ncbi:MAG: 50S ribosomal protein L21 [Planctomycetota bacterium]|nr:50S ribosomal protein L21 [Planctomycetota bacterium]MCX8039729.1 50S ribosomal protein L21 [Planctomycetota bacterium]MDW8373245.1 50S ribosomal protein L21 [Planctomycetota bacterium]